AEFEKAIEINPKNEKAYFSIGTLEMEQGNLTAAIEAFQRAKAVNPADANTAYNLGLAYLQTGKTEKAQDEWEYVLTINAGYPRALYNLALLAAKQGKVQEAGRRYCQFLNAPEGEFPSERALAQKFIEQNHIGCQN
ncbi:MAG: tetratricopeptide repeat protein, partial [Deltaproteobacteria bacterium]|nr:tetratricopeptide repeat protein [Deltaproteobacteria bacterium]